jgi:hypothetical protein
VAPPTPVDPSTPVAQDAAPQPVMVASADGSGQDDPAPGPVGGGSGGS